VKHLLASHAWTSTATDYVFGARGVRVIGGTLGEEAHPDSFPFAVVTMGSSSRPDDDSLPESATLHDQQISVVVAVMAQGDKLGEQAVIGGPRPSYSKSEGAGVAEVMERVYDAVSGLTGANGAGVTISTTGVSGVQTLSGQHRHIAFEEMTLTCAVTQAAFYAAPQHLRQVSSNVEWAGSDCKSRFDFQDFELGYMSGGNPAASPSVDGWTQVATTSNLSTAHTMASGRTYSVFARYKPRGGSSATHFSHVEVGSYKAIS
jgi:hypothetical protein